MSKRWVMMAGALLLLCAAPTAALAVAESMVTVTLGSETPSGPFADVANGGVMAGLNGGYRVTGWLETGVDLSYFNSAGVRNGQSYVMLEPTTGNYVNVSLSEKWTVTEFGLYGRAFVFERGRLGSFLRAGAGTYTVRITQDVSAASATTTLGGNEQVSKFGLSAGLGARYRIGGGTSIGLEALFHHVFARDTDVSFTTIGATLGFGPGGK
jgi:hypothetical protein